MAAIDPTEWPIPTRLLGPLVVAGIAAQLASLVFDRVHLLIGATGIVVAFVAQMIGTHRAMGIPIFEPD